MSNKIEPKSGQKRSTTKMSMNSHLFIHNTCTICIGCFKFMIAFAWQYIAAFDIFFGFFVVVVVAGLGVCMCFFFWLFSVCLVVSTWLDDDAGCRIAPVEIAQLGNPQGSTKFLYINIRLHKCLSLDSQSRCVYVSFHILFFASFFFSLFFHIITWKWNAVLVENHRTEKDHTEIGRHCRNQKRLSSLLLIEWKCNKTIFRGERARVREERK